MRRDTIIVTGASRGIGAGIAVELARRDFKVACLSRSGQLPQCDEPLADAVIEHLTPMACDLTDESAVQATFRIVANEIGPIGGLVNNAGIHQEAWAETIRTDHFEQMMRTNATSVLVACREIYPYLAARNHGTIINIGSLFEKLGVKGSVAYCASKAAVGAITRCLAAEWGAKGVSVLGISPGYIETNINREYLANPGSGSKVRARIFTGRAGQIVEVARLIGAILEEDIAFLTGETIYLDGGQGVHL